MPSPHAECQRCAAELTQTIRRADRGYYECERRLAAFDRRADARVRRLVAAGYVRSTLTWLGADETTAAAVWPPREPVQVRRTAVRSATASLRTARA